MNCAVRSSARIISPPGPSSFPSVILSGKVFGAARSTPHKTNRPSKVRANRRHGQRAKNRLRPETDEDCEFIPCVMREALRLDSIAPPHPEGMLFSFRSNFQARSENGWGEE